MLNAAHRTDGWTVHSGTFEPNYFQISKSYIEYSNIHAAPRPTGGRSLKKEQKCIKFEQMKLAKFWRKKKFKMTSFSSFLKKLVVN